MGLEDRSFQVYTSRVLSGQDRELFFDTRMNLTTESEDVTVLKIVLFLSTLRTLSRNRLAFSNLEVTLNSFFPPESGSAIGGVEHR